MAKKVLQTDQVLPLVTKENNCDAEEVKKQPKDEESSESENVLKHKMVLKPVQGEEIILELVVLTVEHFFFRPSS